MTPTFKLFLLCWAMLFTEKALFWLWLWQEQRYRQRTVRDYFKTKQGKRAIINVLNIGACLFLVMFVFVTVLPKQSTALNWYVLCVFVLDLFLVVLSGRVLFDFVRLKTKIPVLTKNSFALILGCIAFEVLLVFLLAGFQENAVFIFLLVLLFEPLLIAFMILAALKLKTSLRTSRT